MSTDFEAIDLQAPKADLFTAITKWAGLTHQSAVLDVGCSDGRDYFAQLAENGCRLIGVEYDPRLAAQCRQKFEGTSNVQICRGKAEQLPFEDEAYDMVVCNDMIYLCDKQKVLRELHRVLKPGGIVVCLWNQTIGYYVHTVLNPRRKRAFWKEILRSVAIVVNSAIYRCVGKKVFFSATFNTKGELRRTASRAGLTCEKLWIYEGTKPHRICLICRKQPG